MSWERYTKWYVAYEDDSLDTAYYGTLNQAIKGAIRNGKRSAIIGRLAEDEYGNDEGSFIFGTLKKRADGWYVYKGSTRDKDYEERTFLVSPNGMLTPIIPKKKKKDTGMHPFGL